MTTLEPLLPDLEADDNPELRDFQNRFWWTLPLIPTVYPTTADLKKAGQRIVYLLNPHVGHLDIFVSASVAKLEHRAMLESLGDPDCRKSQYTVRFEERQVEQIHYAYPKQSFEKVQAMSEWNELLKMLAPFIGSARLPADETDGTGGAP